MRSEPGSLGLLFFFSMLIHILGSLAPAFLRQKGIDPPVEVMLVFSELTVLVPSMIYVLIKNFNFRNDLGFRPVRTGTVFMCILLSILVTPAASFVNALSQLFVSNQMVLASDSLTSGSNATVLFLGAFYAPFCEEFLFRGIFFNRYDKYVGPLRAGLISAIFFALAHMNVNQAMYAFVLGMFFAVINKAANSIYPSIIVHICINAGNILLLFAATRMYDLMGDADFIASAEAVRQGDGIYYIIGTTFVAAVICTIIAIPCVVWMSKHEDNHEGFMDMFINKHPKTRWFNVPAAAAVFLLLFIMLGLKPVLGLIKGV